MSFVCKSLCVHSICVYFPFRVLKTAAVMKVEKRWKIDIHLALSPTIPLYVSGPLPAFFLSVSLCSPSLCLQGKKLLPHYARLCI